jgi:hypothetical protein
MTMQYDVKQAHINQSGFMVLQRTRVKAVAFVGTATAGQFVLFDTTTAPVSSGVTYARSGTTVTVSKTGHGLLAGQTIGIDYDVGTGGSATPGNYVIATATANTFTITDINSGTITGTPAAVYSTGNWLMTFDVAANDIYNNGTSMIPGEGVLAQNGVYAYMVNMAAVSVVYG